MRERECKHLTSSLTSLSGDFLMIYEPGSAYRLSAQKRDHIGKKQIENGMCCSNTQNFMVLVASTFPIVNKQIDTGICHNNTHKFTFTLAYT